MSFLQSIFFLKIFLEKWVKGKAPATPETKMHDLAAPADGFGWTPLNANGWEVANARVGVGRPRIAGHSFINPIRLN